MLIEIEFLENVIDLSGDTIFMLIAIAFYLNDFFIQIL